jgi:sigma-B regulation protein RsbU (phosphoserine phosphatase)
MKNQWDILTGSPDRDSRNVAILMESVAELYGPAELGEATRRALDRAIRVTGAQRGFLLLGEALTPWVVRDAHGADLPPGQRYSRTVVEKVAATGKAWHTVDVEDDTRASLGQSALDLRLLSIMCVPLAAKGETLGLLYVDSTVTAREFTKEDLKVFEALGGLIAIAVENARLLAERAEKERLQREMDVARDIQQRLFPKELVAPPGFDLAGRGLPCEETSGDYYDVVPLGDGRVALVVGDVSGHGLGPAMFMASARALARALLGRRTSPTEIMQTLNAFLARDMPSSSFMTFFLGILDPATRTLTYANAGHNAPVLVRADGSRAELGRTGPVLSVIDDATYRSADVVLRPGDVAILYTDGIFEAHDPSGEIWGEARFQESFARHVAAGGSASAILDGVLADLMAHAAGRALEDDVTCLVLRTG